MMRVVSGRELGMDGRKVGFGERARLTHMPAAGSYPRLRTRSAQFSPPGTVILLVRSSGIVPKKECVMLRRPRISWLAYSDHDRLVLAS